jgi:hypothetical protein
MSIEIDLGQKALEVANNIQERTLALKRELVQIKTREMHIEAQLEQAHLAHQRLFNYRPTLGPDYQCPRCWIANEKSFPLKPIPSADSSDHFRCTGCQFEFSIDHK